MLDKGQDAYSSTPKGGTATSATNGRSHGIPSSSAKAGKVFKQGDAQPIPDKRVQSIEDAIFEQQPDLGALTILDAEAELPHRPAFGTRGRPVTVWANYFEVLPSGSQQFNSYVVDILPIEPSAGRKPVGKKLKRCMQLLVQQLPSAIAVATDYKRKIITPSSLGFVSRDFGISYSADDSASTPKAIRYQAKVVFEETYTFGDLLEFLSSTHTAAEAPASKNGIIQAANIVFGHGMKQNNGIIAKANKYFPIEGPLTEKFKLGVGLEAFRGFFLSVRPATGRLLLNAQVKHLAAYEPMRLDKLILLLRRDGRDWYAIDRFLHKVYVKIHHTGSLSRVTGLASSRDGANSAHPPLYAAPGASSSVLQVYDESAQSYIRFSESFAKQHKPLQNPGAAVVNISTKKSPVYMPPELCHIVSGQAFQSKLGPDETANMIKFAVRQPAVNARTIVENGAQLVQDHSTVMLSTFGMQVN